MKMMAKICLALTLLLTLPGLAAAAQWDRFDRYDRIDRARLRAEIQRDVREAVRRAAGSYTSGATRCAKRGKRFWKPAATHAARCGERCATPSGTTGAGGTDGQVTIPAASCSAGLQACRRPPG